MNSSIYSWDVPWIMVFFQTSGGFFVRWRAAGLPISDQQSVLGPQAAAPTSLQLILDPAGTITWAARNPQKSTCDDRKPKSQIEQWFSTIVVGIHLIHLFYLFLGWLHIYVVRWFSNHTLEDLPCLISSRYGTTISFFCHWTHVIMWQHPSILDHSTSVWKATANDPEKVSVQCNRHESSTWRMHQPSTSLTYYLGKL